MEADPKKLVHRNSFNITAMHFTPEDIYASIKKYIPEFEMVYEVDPVKAKIASTWPNWMDDTCARQEWDFNPNFDLDSMTQDMIKVLREKFSTSPSDWSTTASGLPAWHPISRLGCTQRQA